MANGTLKVSNIQTSSGSGTITIGQSGETVTIPSGCTITNSGTSTGFGGVNTPSFMAYFGSAVNPSNDTNTDAAYDTEVFDVGGCYNNTSGTVTLNGISTPAYSFAPNEAGKYLVFAVLRFGSDSSRPAFDQTQMRLRKNSSDCANQILSTYSSYYIDAFNLPLTTIVEANGTSDTFKMDYYLSVETGTITVYSGQHQTYFGAYKIIE